MKKFILSNEELELFFEAVLTINFSFEDFAVWQGDFHTRLECDCTQEQEREIELIIENL